MTCNFCLEKPNCGDEPRRCAFKMLVFDADNRNCATLNALKGFSTLYGRHETAPGQHIWVLPFDGGWIVLTAYKTRGRVSGALYIREEETYILPRAVAEKAIAHYRERHLQEEDAELLE